MKKSKLTSKCILVVTGAFLLQSAPVLADEGLPPPSGGMGDHSRNFDWVQHTQHTLDEVKAKLNLTPDQMTAWDAWSRGVLKDARQQLEQRKSWHDEKGARGKSVADGTTPELMARGIERLRVEVNWMQEHLVQLEAAQVRTKAFYNALDTNQKTIFDLFWHEFYHRVSGHEDASGMHEYGSSGFMMEEHAGQGRGH